jgi:hypothetical protein
MANSHERQLAQQINMGISQILNGKPNYTREMMEAIQNLAHRQGGVGIRKMRQGNVDRSAEGYKDRKKVYPKTNY